MTMKRSIPTVLLSVLAIMVPTLLSQQKSDTQMFKPAPEIPVQIVNADNIPLQFVQPVIERDAGRQLFKIDFIALNKGFDPLQSIAFAVYVVTPEGSVRSGESWVASQGLAPGEKRQIIVPLRSQFNVNDHAVLLVQRVVEDDYKLEIKSASLLDSFRSQNPITVTASKSAINRSSIQGNAGVQPDFLCDGSFCLSCKQSAQEFCSGGVKSFSCSITPCACHFECYPPKR